MSKGRRRQRERRGRDRRQSREAPTVPAAQNHQTSTLSTIIISIITTIIISISIVIRKGLPSVERRRHLEAVHRKTRQISLFSTSTVTSHGLIYWLYAYFAFSRGIFLVTDGHFEARKSGNLALPMREALCEYSRNLSTFCCPPLPLLLLPPHHPPATSLLPLIFLSHCSSSSSSDSSKAFLLAPHPPRLRLQPSQASAARYYPPCPYYH